MEERGVTMIGEMVLKYDYCRRGEACPAGQNWQRYRGLHPEVDAPAPDMEKS